MEGHVDTGRHSGSGKHGAVLDPAFRDGRRAELGQQVAEAPVGGGLTAVEQAGGAQDQGAGAHRADHLSRSRGLADPPQQRLVGQGGEGRLGPAGHDQREGFGDLVERVTRRQLQRCVGTQGREVPSDDDHVERRIDLIRAAAQAATASTSSSRPLSPAPDERDRIRAAMDRKVRARGGTPDSEQRPRK